MMGNTIQKHIEKAVSGGNLSRDEAEYAFQIIMNGGATPAQMAGFLIALRIKGESVEEIAAGARVMRAKARPFAAPDNAIDVCGTGGDAKGTLNVSTAVAIVVAACGLPVVKHGNRSVSSHSGSSDVLSALNVDVNAPFELLEKALAACNLTFLMAPRFHSAMRHIAPVRQELGLRTIFNLLGPLSNPARPHFQVMGVYDRGWLRPMAEVLRDLGSERAWIVHGCDGLDELSISDESLIVELKDGEIREFSITPEAVGLPRATLSDISGKGPDYNAQKLNHLLIGEKNAYRDIVLLNAAAALVVGGKAADLPEGISLAAAAIDSRRALQVLATLSTLTSSPDMYHG